MEKIIACKKCGQIGTLSDDGFCGDCYESDDEPDHLIQWGPNGFYKGRAVREYEADDDL